MRTIRAAQRRAISHRATKVWVQKVAMACDAFVGRTVGERDAELPALARAIAREHGAAKRGADGVAHMLVRRFTTEVDAAADPTRVRRVTFEEAAREEIFNRKLTLASASQRLAALLCTYSVCESGTRRDVSGPLSILRHTTKYGFALASFFPAVVATPGFRLEARCVLGGEPMLVRIDASDRIAQTHKLPKDADSAAEVALARDVRRLGTSGRLSASPTPSPSLGALRGAANRALIVCIDESLACDEGEIPGAVLRFKRRIDAATLIAAAERQR